MLAVRVGFGFLGAVGFIASSLFTSIAWMDGASYTAIACPLLLLYAAATFLEGFPRLEGRTRRPHPPLHARITRSHDTH